jgi:chemotaxis protein methyltransferase CheR
MPLNLLSYDEASLSEYDFRRVSDVIYQHCGIKLHDGKKSLVRARLAKKLRESRFSTFKEYIDYVLSREGQKEFYSFVDSLSTNLTFFFREKSHFEYLEQYFLPSCVSFKGKNINRNLRFWSAGCSTGEEAYSLAIALDDYFRDKSGWNIKILASDVSTRVLEVAKLGTYDKERVKAVAPERRHRYLIPSEIEGRKVYQIHPSLRKMIAFRYLNLMESWPFKGLFDCIFCRNVMIYFDKATQEKLIGRFWEHLNKGGLLCIGHSESLTGINHKFGYIRPATYVKSL